MDIIPDYGAVAAQLMAKMGFKEGMGLGRSENGIREPVAVDVGQKKNGLGYSKPKRKRKRKRNKQPTHSDLLDSMASISIPDAE